MPAETPSPLMVAEARVERHADCWTVALHNRYRDGSETMPWMLQPGGDWKQFTWGSFPDEPSARAALARAQEAAGVYARKPEWTCECVRLSDNQSWGCVVGPHAMPLTPTDRKRVWLYDPTCHYGCRLGVPRPAHAAAAKENET